MLEINGDDIALLSDTDLRTLVAELCRTELRHLGHPISAVTAGGDQNAPDGGLDIRVELPTPGVRTDFIPRGITGFQVKVPDMPASVITAEMCPGGTVRPVLQELANVSGAYIIVSAKGSTADLPLQKRREAMRTAVATIPNEARLHLDFYDRNQVAAWVRLYPAMTAWVRDRLGRPLLGWKGFDSWSAPLESIDAEFILDKGCRLYDIRTQKPEGLSIENGIGRMREVLSREGGTARLIGLSGLGKTRLAQALFDTRIGREALDPGTVMYTDLSDEPTPSPRDLISHLVHSGFRAIVIIDNCNPEAHRALVKACSVSGTKVSLLTVEYDVGEDEPEGTEVFRLEAASTETIEQLVFRREPHISQVDRRRIATLSGGNSRVALALAKTVKRGDSVAQLADKDLFRRLFHQRHPEDTSLMRAAEVCSLVYSFDGDVTDDDACELTLLSELAGMTVDELYRHTVQLKDRDLLQKRSKWKAILPHALANNLAKAALDSLVPHKLQSVIIGRGTDRLKRSFSRRLNFLHDSPPARDLVTSWYEDGNLLGDLNTLDRIHFEIFKNIAPVVPESTLSAIEMALSASSPNLLDDSNREHRHIVASTLKSLAFDPMLFLRSIRLLIRLAVNEPITYGNNNPKALFKELFQISLSGTHARVDERLVIIDGLLQSANEESLSLGLDGLNEMFKTSHFTSSHTDDFGAHPRDYGWQPRTGLDVLGWYQAVLRFTLRLINENPSQRERLSSIIASNFRGLWRSADLMDDLENAVDCISTYGHWSGGWIAVKATLNFDGTGMPENMRSRLQGIEFKLRPTNLLDEARVFAFSKAWSNLDPADGEDDDPPEELGSRYQRTDERTVEIGCAVASDPEILKKILPDLVRGKETGRRNVFGVGLANGTKDLSALLSSLGEAISSTPEEERNIDALRGILSQAINLNPTVVHAFLDNAIEDEVMGRWFPILQCSAGVDKRGVVRLIKSVQLGTAPIQSFGILAYGRATDPIDSNDLAGLLSEFSQKEGGVEVALDILSMKLLSLKDAGPELDQDLNSCGQSLLLKCDFSKPRHRIDYEMARVAETCLAGSSAAEIAGQICLKLSTAFASYTSSPHDYNELMATLFKVQPSTALTSFLEDEGSQSIRWQFDDFSTNKDHPVGSIPMADLMAWADSNPESRYPALASVVPFFGKAIETGEEIISSTALQLLDASPDKSAVLLSFSTQFRPSGWSGSLADILDGHRMTIQKLLPHPVEQVNTWVAVWGEKLTEAARRERLRDQVSVTSFE